MNSEGINLYWYDPTSPATIDIFKSSFCFYPDGAKICSQIFSRQDGYLIDVCILSFRYNIQLEPLTYGSNRLGCRCRL